MSLALLYVTTAAFAGELHDAVRAQNKAAVESILSRAAAVDETDFILGTPLHVAVSNGDREIAKILIGHGADVEAISEQQSARAAHLAAQFGDTVAFAQSYSAVGDASLIEYLLRQGADPNAKDASGLSALAYADFQVRQGAVIYVEIAEELRRLGVTE